MQIIAFHKHEIATFKAVGAEIGQVQCLRIRIALRCLNTVEYTFLLLFQKILAKSSLFLSYNI